MKLEDDDKPVEEHLRQHTRTYICTDRRTGPNHNASSDPQDRQRRYKKSTNDVVTGYEDIN